jgi:hypothetical protein
MAVWLAAGEKRRMRPVQAHLRRSTLDMSPVVLLEMEVLREIGRIRAPTSALGLTSVSASCDVWSLAL